ncbi:BNR/Asp-box repeat-containing protein [Gracilibacillus kekensis]|uniref:BNR/Asp-box repeat-containing protein n=2 Tax=Gracilibacillus kekensis TaxID=1027249 RepID=A0A1M7Q9U9_9BACI|nr:BNR/Asp-box repeat-containing protein [Gracilibacillus kekensis]
MKKMMIALSSLMLVAMVFLIIVYEGREPLLSPEAKIIKTQQTEVTSDPERQPLKVIETPSETDYSLQNDQLHITHDNGDTWHKVPIEIEHLFAGEYQGNRQELIGGSYEMTEEYTAFLYSEGEDWQYQTIKITYTDDKGKTWKESIVKDEALAMRFRKIDITNDGFWTVIFTFDRTMSQEASAIYLSNDQGENWQSISTPDSTRLVADGGFIDQNTGFISYGTLNPDAPTSLYVTNDQGETWEQSVFNMPNKYEEVFVIAKSPIEKEDHLELIMEQGPNGDYYRNGLIKAKFISKDNGQTWEFVEEVEPENEEMG